MNTKNKKRAEARFYRLNNGDLCAVFYNVPAAGGEPEMRRGAYIHNSDGGAEACDIDEDYIRTNGTAPERAEDIGRLVIACCGLGFSVLPVNLPGTLE